jgi:hypothetical protein
MLSDVLVSLQALRYALLGLYDFPPALLLVCSVEDKQTHTQNNPSFIPGIGGVNFGEHSYNAGLLW